MNHEFVREMLKTVGAFLEGKTPKDVRIQYRDDEDTFVNLSCDEDLIDACRYLRPVDNSKDLYSLSVRVYATPLSNGTAYCSVWSSNVNRQRNKSLQHRKYKSIDGESCSRISRIFEKSPCPRKSELAILGKSDILNKKTGVPVPLQRSYLLQESAASIPSFFLIFSSQSCSLGMAICLFAIFNFIIIRKEKHYTMILPLVNNIEHSQTRPASILIY